jgi:hypothetical protein
MNVGRVERRLAADAVNPSRRTRQEERSGASYRWTAITVARDIKGVRLISRQLKVGACAHVTPSHHLADEKPANAGA